ncbi:MAG TPA: amidohydrolase family protein, partial [Polyangia bacterium]|nr:amidohydrolase family protein [Polyangia bacterium]
MRVVSARWVIPVDRPPIAEGALALDGDGTVRMVGARAAVRAEFAGAPEERAEGALLPGLVNAHCHLELSALAGAVPGGGGFIAWAQRFLKTAGETPRDRRQAAAREAAAAAVRLGTAAIGDVGNTLDAAPALGAAGLPGVLFHELVGSREAKTGDALGDAARERAQLEADTGWPAALGYVRAPHAPYSVGPDLMRRIFAAAGAEARATSIHVAEDVEELKLLRDGTGAWPGLLAAMGVDPATRVSGKSPVDHLASLGAFDGARPPLLVHMVHAGAGDRRLAREAGATVVLCPRSNLHIGGRLADVPALLDDGVSIALGTDSL